MSVAVRAATADDVDGVRAVARDAWYAAYSGFVRPEDIEAELAESYDSELLESAVDHDDIAFYVAAVDEEVTGFASAEQTWADEVELHTIYVHPERWGEGIGSALLEKIRTFARDTAVDRIVCAVFDENVVGVGFVEASGFERGKAVEARFGGERLAAHEFEWQL